MQHNKLWLSDNLKRFFKFDDSIHYNTAMFKMVSMVTLYLILGYTPARFVSQLFYSRWCLNDVGGWWFGRGGCEVAGRGRGSRGGAGFGFGTHYCMGMERMVGTLGHSKLMIFFNFIFRAKPGESACME